MEYPIFFVVNDNQRTRNPANGEQYSGVWCESSGHQVLDPKYATPYYTRKGAQALVNRLHSEGIKCPAWARKHHNDANQLGHYRIVEGVTRISL